MGHLAQQQAGRGRQVGRDPDVYHDHLGTHLRGEGVDHRAAGQEVLHHLRGHLLRPRGYATGVHTVICGEDRDRGRLGHRGRALTRKPGEPDGQFLQRAERARRLGHPSLVVTCRGDGGRSSGPIAAIVSARLCVGRSIGSSIGTRCAPY